MVFYVVLAIACLVMLLEKTFFLLSEFQQAVNDIERFNQNIAIGNSEGGLKNNEMLGAIAAVLNSERHEKMQNGWLLN